jgi:hypothetical protein
VAARPDRLSGLTGIAGNGVDCRRPASSVAGGLDVRELPHVQRRPRRMGRRTLRPGLLAIGIAMGIVLAACAGPLPAATRTPGTDAAPGASPSTAPGPSPLLEVGLIRTLPDGAPGPGTPTCVVSAADPCGTPTPYRSRLATMPPACVTVGCIRP